MYCVAFMLLWTGLAVNSERHSLTYIYTAFSKPVGLPGIHEFTAMGLLDNRMIDYFDSDSPNKVPKQGWMEERMPMDYWNKGTQSRQSKQLWFKINIDILMKRMRQNDSDVHVLQWMHGCEGETQPDGIINFHRGMDMYSYDGNDFLSFDDAHGAWVAPTEEAVQTKRKWAEDDGLKEYTKGYLEYDCIQWLSTFVNYSQKQLREAPPPKVHVFARSTKVETNVILTCLVTGFYPKDIILQIKRDGHVLKKEDGVCTSGVRPNGDETYQRRDSVEILRSDLSTYSCEVNHTASKLHIKKDWDRTLPPPVGSGGVGVVIGGAAGGLIVLVTVAVVLFVLYKKGVIGFSGRSSSGTGTPLAAVVVPPGMNSTNTAEETTAFRKGSDGSGVSSFSSGIVSINSTNTANETTALMNRSEGSLNSVSSGVATNGQSSQNSLNESESLLEE